MHRSRDTRPSVSFNGLNQQTIHFDGYVLVCNSYGLKELPHGGIAVGYRPLEGKVSGLSSTMQQTSNS